MKIELRGELSWFVNAPQLCFLYPFIFFRISLNFDQNVASTGYVDWLDLRVELKALS